MTRTLRTLTGATLLTLLVAGPASAVPIEFESSGMYFDIINAGFHIPWAAADIAAEALIFNGVAGHLADPKTAALDAFLIATFDVFNPANPNNSFQFGNVVFGPWIGLHTIGSPSNLADYRWSDGSVFNPLTYSGWLSGEPNGDGAPGVDYLSIVGGGSGWNDEGCQGGCPGPVSFIVQYDTVQAVPEPGTLVLMAPALVVGLRMSLRRK